MVHTSKSILSIILSFSVNLCLIFSKVSFKTKFLFIESLLCRCFLLVSLISRSRNVVLYFDFMSSYLLIQMRFLSGMVVLVF